MRNRQAHVAGILVAAVAIAAALVARHQRATEPVMPSTIASSPQDTAWQETAEQDTTTGGTDARGIPHYLTGPFSASEHALLFAAYGIDDPTRLYMSDSTESAILKYDAIEKRCLSCYVDSYRVGFLSLRRVGEGWSAFESRIRRLTPSDFPASARQLDTSLDDLTPAARSAFGKLLTAGRATGFHLTVRETYRSPAREALLFAEGRGRTYTATSMHSYRRAVDIIVGDGRIRNASTRAEWVRFRQFVLTRGGAFRLIGRPDYSWDWPHVELVADNIGFRSIESALAFAARCTTDSARARPPSAAALGGAVRDPCVFVP
jgi:hypothetical protein